MIKIVREHINEKFIEDSDPIIDLGIGVLPTKIKKLFNKYFSEYGELDVKYVFKTNDTNNDIAYVYIPYSTRKEKEQIRNMESIAFGSIITELTEDVLQPAGKDLWNHSVYRSRSFKNKNKFHFYDRGLICKIEICKFNNDPEAEW